MDFDRSQQEQQNIDNQIQQALSGYGPSIQSHPDTKPIRSNIVPIDPSIADSIDKDSGSDFARSTAQAAVRSSQKGSSEKVSKPRVNKPGQKFGAKKKSWVWSWFTQHEGDGNAATCMECTKTITRLASDKGSPKKLGEHLRTHKIDKHTPTGRRDGLIVQSDEGQRHYYNTLNAGQVSYKVHPLSHATENDSGVQDGQSESAPGLDLSEFSQEQYTQRHLQMQVMRFIVQNKLSLAVAQSSSFRQLIYLLRPSAIADLNELDRSALDVVHRERHETKEQTQQDENSNVDEQLTSGDGEWEV